MSSTRAEIYAFLTEDHVRLGALLRRAIADPVVLDLDAYTAFRAGLLRHIAMEEKVLFPYARAQRGGEPLALAKRLRADHAALGSLLIATPAHDVARAIVRVLAEHDPLEEDLGGVYDQCEGYAVAAGEVATVVAQLAAVPPVAMSPYRETSNIYEHIERILLERERFKGA